MYAHLQEHIILIVANSGHCRILVEKFQKVKIFQSLSSVLSKQQDNFHAPNTSGQHKLSSIIAVILAICIMYFVFFKIYYSVLSVIYIHILYPQSPVGLLELN